MISGICDICGNVGFIQTCRMCGKKVCILHYDSSTETCIMCSMGKIHGVGI